MWTLIRNGGIPPMLFILMTGVVGLLAAFHFALRARRQSLGFIKMMAAATLFGTLAASCAAVGATLHGAERSFHESDPGSKSDRRDEASEEESRAQERENMPRVIHIIIEGFAESTSAGILGFGFLALSSMLVAVGRRRLDEREAREI